MGGRWIARLRRAVTLCAEKSKKQGRTLIKQSPTLFFGEATLFFQSPAFCSPAARARGFVPRVCVCSVLSLPPAAAAPWRGGVSEGVADGQMIGQRVLEARHVVPSALTRVVRRVKGNAHVETDDQKVEVVAQAYAGAYGNVFQVFQ